LRTRRIAAVITSTEDPTITVKTFASRCGGAFCKENRNDVRAARGNSDYEGDAIFQVAFSPEREDPGNTSIARRDIPKVVDD
jgi:hypothetical protein